MPGSPTHSTDFSRRPGVSSAATTAAGIALKNSTILINRIAAREPIQVEPLPPEIKKQQPVDEFKLPVAPPPIITPPTPDGIKIEVEPVITTALPEAPHIHSDPGGGGGGSGGGSVEPVRHQPVNVAAVIDAASCAKPAYPAGALRNGDEGTVTLAFLVGKDGHVASAKIERTSGHRDLDRAALQGLSMCAFKPGTIDGVAQESWARMQYAWRLDE